MKAFMRKERCFFKGILAKTLDSKGVSFISVSIFILVVGMIMAGGARYFELWSQNIAVTETEDKIRDVQKQLRIFAMENGRYPCPAPLTAVPDTNTYGVEVTATDCDTGAFAGTFTSAGRNGRPIRSGALPTRTLNLPDDYMTDGWSNRLVYAVTSAYAMPGAPFDQDNGAITIQDDNDNNATATTGNIIQVVLSMGPDDNGAHSYNGILKQACDGTARAGENCNHDDVFVNTVAHSSSNDATLNFSHRIAYGATVTPVSCEDAATDGGPLNVAYLLDTSGSMDNQGVCPPDLPSDCWRMDVAHWALRRVVPARIQQGADADEPGATSMTGFVTSGSSESNHTVTQVDSNMGDIIIDDPTESGYTPPDPDDFLNSLENDLQSMCPNGWTPLGSHIQVLADRLGSGTPERPNVITVISDGLSNKGVDPNDAAQYVVDTYDYLQVDIIDVVGNPTLQAVANITGGAYYFTDNPSDLLDALYESTGTCADSSAPPPVDQQHCH